MNPGAHVIVTIPGSYLNGYRATIIKVDGHLIECKVEGQAMPHVFDATQLVIDKVKRVKL